ncbi:MAG: serine hydrolase [Eubacteriales bacterium]|nr:serine hydrolase [Eubacteriales bacterium]
MKLKERIRRQSFWLKGMMAAVLFMAAILFGYTTELLPASQVQAAAAQTSAKKKTTTTIYFTNKSGTYLKKIKNEWYLKNSKNKALTGIQYLVIPKKEGLETGYYMFDKKGMLVQKSAVYYVKKQKIGKVVFRGYHYTGPTGRFYTHPNGIIYLKNKTCNGRTFNGLYYLGDHGRLTDTAQMRRISAKKVGNIYIATGYYYFTKHGQLRRAPEFHSLNQTLNGKRYVGNYYFGGANGALCRKAGWITLNNKQYYVTASGKRYENCWKQGYYFLSDGTVAKNQRVPDGSYVDCDGHKCTKAEMKLSSLKKQVKAMTDGYYGTWSVYVKNLKTGDVLSINDQAMYPASVIKPFVMASTFDQINRKKLAYTSTVKSLLKSMITVSDNESYNQLVRMNSPSGNFVSGAAVVNSYLKKNGYTKTGCHSTLHPSSSYFTSDGSSNTSSAKDCGVLLEKIYKGTCVSSKYSKEMLDLLLGQTRRWKIPSSLPAGTKVANKTGETSTVQHDMAIVYGPKTTYVICVFSSNVSEYNGNNGIRNVSRYIYNYLNN